MVRRHWGMAVLVAVSAALVALIAYVYVAAYGTGDPQSERAAAMRAARYEMAKSDLPVLAATYRPNAGEDRESNTGHSCFGRTVLVRLVYPKNAGLTSGNPSGRLPAGHEAVLATADATSGTVCFVSVGVGAAAADPEPDEIYLFGPRPDLLTGSP